MHKIERHQVYDKAKRIIGKKNHWHGTGENFISTDGFCLYVIENQKEVSLEFETEFKISHVSNIIKIIREAKRIYSEDTNFRIAIDDIDETNATEKMSNEARYIETELNKIFRFETYQLTKQLEDNYTGTISKFYIFEKRMNDYLTAINYQPVNEKETAKLIKTQLEYDGIQYEYDDIKENFVIDIYDVKVHIQALKDKEMCLNIERTDGLLILEDEFIKLNNQMMFFDILNIVERYCATELVEKKESEAAEFIYETIKSAVDNSRNTRSDVYKENENELNYLYENEEKIISEIDKKDTIDFMRILKEEAKNNHTKKNELEQLTNDFELKAFKNKDGIYEIVLQSDDREVFATTIKK